MRCTWVLRCEQLGNRKSIRAGVPKRIADWKQPAIRSIKSAGFSGMGSKAHPVRGVLPRAYAEACARVLREVDVSSEGRATARDAAGRRFESGTSFHWIAQMGRASDDYSDGRGFDSRSNQGESPSTGNASCVGKRDRQGGRPGQPTQRVQGRIVALNLGGWRWKCWMRLAAPCMEVIVSPCEAP